MYLRNRPFPMSEARGVCLYAWLPSAYEMSNLFSGYLLPYPRRHPSSTCAYTQEPAYTYFTKVEAM